MRDGVRDVTRAAANKGSICFTNSPGTRDGERDVQRGSFRVIAAVQLSRNRRFAAAGPRECLLRRRGEKIARMRKSTWTWRMEDSRDRKR